VVNKRHLEDYIDLLLESFKKNKKMSYGKKPLMRLLDIKKVLDKNAKRYRSEKIEVRATPEEKELLRKIAKNNDMRFSDFIREKLFS